MPILIPGVGAQGGDLNSCMRIGNKVGLVLLIFLEVLALLVI